MTTPHLDHPTKTNLDDQVYEVLSALIQTLWGDSHIYLVSNRSSPTGDSLPPYKSDPDGTIDQIMLQDELIDNWTINNQQPVYWENKFLLKSPVVLMDPDEYHKLTEDMTQMALIEKYPGADGLIILSRPGFSPRRNYAIVEYSLCLSRYAGHGGLVLLSRKTGSWQITDTLYNMMV